MDPLQTSPRLLLTAFQEAYQKNGYKEPPWLADSKQDGYKLSCKTIVAEHDGLAC